MSDSNQPVLACTFSPQQQARRRDELRNDFFPDVTQVRELPDGYVLRFDWSQSKLQAIGAFLAEESDCCSFMSFEVQVPPQRSAIWLSLRGPGDTKAGLKQELVTVLPQFEALSHAGPRLAFKAGAGLFAASVAAMLCCVFPVGALLGLGATATAGSTWLVLTEQWALGLGLLGAGTALVVAGIHRLRRSGSLQGAKVAQPRRCSM